MPRDGSGVYTLPVGNPVVTLTPIASTWANPTMGDIAAQLNNVVTRDGLLGPVGPFKVADGTVVAPGLAWNSEPGLGWYRPSTSKRGFAVAGVQVENLDASNAAEVFAEVYPRVAGTSSINVYNQPAGSADTNYLSVEMNATVARIVSAGVGATAAKPLSFEGPSSSFNHAVTVRDNLVANTAGPAGAPGQQGFSINVTEQSMYLYTTPAYRLAMNTTSGITFLQTNGVVRTSWNIDGTMTHAGAAYKPGGGAWLDSSDARIKHEIRDYEQGLDAILALRPRIFKFRPETGREQRDYVGLVYQESGAMPEMQSTKPVELGDMFYDDMGVLDPSPVVWALVNSVKKLHERINHLESHSA